MGLSKDGMRLILAVIMGWALLQPTIAPAGVFEISGTVAYSTSNLNSLSYSRQNRYSAELAWRFTQVSAIEISYMRSRTKIAQTIPLQSMLYPSITQTVLYDDHVYSASWVQNLVPATWILQPYFKIGGGRLNRKQKVDYSVPLIPNQEANQKVDTGVAGFGARLFLTKSMALKGEFVTYVPKYRFSKWKDAQMFSVGLSWIF